MSEDFRNPRNNPLAIIVTVAERSPAVSHIPLICNEGSDGSLLLQGHCAKANPHSRIFDNKQVTTILNGAHGYISPSWYVSSEEAPTWNYRAIHCSGLGTPFEDRNWLIRFPEKLVDDAHKDGSHNLDFDTDSGTERVELAHSPTH